MNPALHLVEKRTDDDDQYWEYWFVPPPEKGTPYIVTEQTWNSDHTRRYIHGWQGIAE